MTRIVHYGDSPTTADLITGDVRAAPAKALRRRRPRLRADRASPWAWYQHTRRRSCPPPAGRCAGQPLRSARRPVRPGRRDVHRAARTPPARSSSARPGPDALRSLVSAPARTAASLTFCGGWPAARAQSTPAADAKAPGFAAFAVPGGASDLELRVERGPVRVFGITAEKAGPGVVYDSLGLNGASITVLSRMFNAEALGRGTAPSPSRPGGDQLRHQRSRFRGLHR